MLGLFCGLSAFGLFAAFVVVYKKKQKIEEERRIEKFFVCLQKELRVRPDAKGEYVFYLRPRYCPAFACPPFIALSLKKEGGTLAALYRGRLFHCTCPHDPWFVDSSSSNKSGRRLLISAIDECLTVTYGENGVAQHVTFVYRADLAGVPCSG